MDTLKLLIRILSLGALVVGYLAWTWHAVRQLWRYRHDPYRGERYDERTFFWVAVFVVELVVILTRSLIWAWH